MKRRKIDLRELQLIELDILRVFDTLCKEHGITYYLAYGTLLGAVRHKGFIPWDDDIDVLVPRPDYERLATILKHGTLPGGYGYGSLEDPGYVYPYMKLYYKYSLVHEKKFEEAFQETPIWIDIFPIDGLPSRPSCISARYAINKQLRNLLYTALVNPSMLTGAQKYMTIMLKPFAKTIGAHRIALWIDKLSRRIPYASSHMVGNVAFGFGPCEAIEREKLSGAVSLEFEGVHFMVPKCYECQLRDNYGNFMELPPLEKRQSHLGEECFLLE